MKKNRALLIIAIIIVLVSTFILPKESYREHVYYYGFPINFFTLYTSDFLSSIGSESPFQFHFNIVQLIVNIFIVYLLLLSGSYVIPKITFFINKNTL